MGCDWGIFGVMKRIHTELWFIANSFRETWLNYRATDIDRLAWNIDVVKERLYEDEKNRN